VPNPWSPEQLSNAKTIVQVGRSLGASDRDLTIALMAAWQESQLRNVHYGDRDSLGLFQQRAGWATAADRLDPVKAARMFFTGGEKPGTRGLLDFSNRDSWSLGQAAQRVQVSAYPDAYAKWEDESKSMLSELGGMVPTQTQTTGETPLPVLPTATSEAPSPATSALGVDSPVTPGLEAPGTASPTAPGIEAADEQPAAVPFDFTDFLPSSTGQPGGVANTFESTFPTSGPTGGIRQRAIDIAKSAIGVNYVWGGNDLSSGVDCSGLVQQVYKQLGVNLPRISAQQARAGKQVSLSALQPGDLVAWDNSSRNAGADHIAIYIGNGQIIEAPRPGLGVRIRSLGNDKDAWGVHLNI
jgi:cell wall-associated NlpC family hydrolase